jgi:hypothetical protein
VDQTIPPGQEWYIYAEIATADLLSGPQLAVIASGLERQPAVQMGEVAAGSVGQRFSVSARIRLRADNARTAENEATTMLNALLTNLNVNPGTIIAQGLISDS